MATLRAFRFPGRCGGADLAPAPVGAYMNVAGNPAPLVAASQRRGDAGRRSCILGSGTDAETLRLLANAIIPRLTIPERRNDFTDGER